MKNGYLPRKTFFWTISLIVGITVAVFGYLIGRVDNVTEAFNHNLTTVKEDISELKTDVRWIKNSLGYED